MFHLQPLLKRICFNGTEYYGYEKYHFPESVQNVMGDLLGSDFVSAYERYTPERKPYRYSFARFHRLIPAKVLQLGWGDLCTMSKDIMPLEVARDSKTLPNFFMYNLPWFLECVWYVKHPMTDYEAGRYIINVLAEQGYKHQLQISLPSLLKGKTYTPEQALNMVDTVKEKNEMRRNFTTQVSTRGYQLVYKGQPIGGAGIGPNSKAPTGRAATKQIDDYRKMALRDIQKGVLYGFPQYQQKIIDRLDVKE